MNGLHKDWRLSHWWHYDAALNIIIHSDWLLDWSFLHCSAVRSASEQTGCAGCSGAGVTRRDGLSSRSHTARRRRHAIPSHTAHGRLAGIMIVKPGDVKQHGQVWLWHGWNCRFGATPQVTLYQHYWYNLMHQFTALYSRSQYAYRFYYEFNFSDVEISKVILTLESHRSREHWCV